MSETIEACIAQETRLGELAMEFRGTTDLKVRERIRQDYSAVVQKLVDSGQWDEIPPFEDLLPDEYMPASFFKRWGLTNPNTKRAKRTG